MNKEMIVDTNILIHLFTQDDDTQIEQLVQLMEQGEIAFYVLSIVLIEAYWVLQKYITLKKKRLCEFLRTLSKLMELCLMKMV